MAGVGPDIEAVQKRGSIVRFRECLPARITRTGFLFFFCYSGPLLLYDERTLSVGFEVIF